MKIVSALDDLIELNLLSNQNENIMIYIYNPKHELCQILHTANALRNKNYSFQHIFKFSVELFFFVFILSIIV